MTNEKSLRFESLGKIEMKLSYWASLFLLALGGCAATIEPIPQPESGYSALRFRQAAQVRDHSINIYIFSAGSTFVNDRKEKDMPVYCGPATINDAQTYTVCLGYKGDDTIIIGPRAGFKEVTRTLPSGTLEEVKVKM
ncbi:hypothetical protein GCM10007094_41100 [Pseudovibrio japonicus]|uniref:Lipoprotein n=1 Tax=Pseudovibrio japonicus TaxID=366534 RepID=A0ABQ3EMZ6_9HYPH|nr:hypothetical protein [Pseudovibrio japonicus]GHB47589.1 hypothetical protein GCM10007094_41100 [Pseudovibrio japonicus]